MDITVPNLPESTSEAYLVRIYVSTGQEVEFDQILFDVETDKMVLEVVAPSDGIVDKIVLSEGDSVSSEQLVMRLHEKVESNSSAVPKSTPQVEGIEEESAKGDSERLALEQVIGQSLFDKRGVICGMFGLFVGIVLGAIGTMVVLG